MSTLVPTPADGKAFVRPGFRWDAADAYLFDIDGTLLNSRDAVHYFAFQSAVRAVLNMETSIEGVHVHGNTDPGIVRAVLQRAGLDNNAIDAHMPQIVAHMCAEVERNQEQLSPELLPIDPRFAGPSAGGAASSWERRQGTWRPWAGSSWRRRDSSRCLRSGRSLSRGNLARTSSSTVLTLPGSGWAPRAVTVVGDTPSDIDAARAIGVPVIVLATGIFSFADLKAHGPDACSVAVPIS